MGVQDRSILGLQIKTETVGQADIDKLTASFNKFVEGFEKQSKRISDQNDRMASSFSKMQADAEKSLGKLKSAIADPLAAAGEVAESFVLKFGKVGTAVTVGATAIATGAYAIHQLVVEQGKAAEQALNFADRTGIAVGEGQKLSAMARIAGVDIGFLENASARLAASLEDQGAKGDKARQALHDLNVSTLAQSGDQRELEGITLDAVKALAGLDDTARRTAKGSDLFGRGFNGITPMIRNFRDLYSVVTAAGIGLDEAGTRKLAAFDDQIDLSTEKWNELKRTLAAKIAPIEIQIISKAQGVLDYMLNGNTDNPGGYLGLALRRGADLSGPFSFNGALDYNNFLNPSPPHPSPLLSDPNAEIGKVLAPMYQRRFAAEALQDPDQLRKQLAKLQQNRDTLQAALVEPKVGGKEKGEKEKELDQNDRGIAQLQAQIKLLEQRKTIEEDIAKLREDASTKDLSKQLGIDPNNALPSQQKMLDLLSRRGITPPQSDQVKALLAPKILDEQQKKINTLGQTLDVTNVTAEEQRAQQSGAAAIRRIQSSVTPGDSGQALQAENRIADIRIQTAQRTFDLEKERIELETAFLPAVERGLITQTQLVKAQGDLEKETQDAKLDREQKIADIQRQELERQKQQARDLSVAGIVNQEQSAQNAGERQIQRIQLTARPGEEVGVANQALQIRLRTAQQINDLEQRRIDQDIAAMKADEQAGAKKLANIKLEGDLQKAQQDAQVEFQNQILQIQQQQQNQARDAAGRTFDAITASGKDGLVQLGQTFAKTIERQIFVNLSSVVFDQARKAASTAIPGQIDPKTGNLTTLGKIFQGTPLGIDPLKQATIDQTRATRDLTAEFRKYNNGSSSGGDIPTLLDRPLLRTPGYSPEDDLKDSSAVKAAKEKETAAQDAGTAAIKSLTNKLVGIGSTAAIGAAGVVGGVAQGGLQGAVAAAGSVATTLGTVLPQISKSLSIAGPISAIAGLGLSLVSSLLPNAKAKFDSEQDATIKKNAYVAPTAQSQNADATGSGNLGTNLRGAPNVTFNYTINAVDTKGVKAFFDTHAPTAAEAIGKIILGGQSPNMTLAINKTAFPGAS